MSKFRIPSGASLFTLVLAGLLMALGLSGVSLGLGEEIAATDSVESTDGAGGTQPSRTGNDAARTDGRALADAIGSGHVHAGHAAHGLATATAASTEATETTETSGGRPRPQPVGFTEGYGNDKVLSFRYDQQFFCTDERFDDLDGPGHMGDGITAAEDPDEFQHPAMGPPGSPCIVGATRPDPRGGSLPTIDPTGAPVAGVEKIWAIIPFFDSSRDADTVLEAIEPSPSDTSPVDVQCPEPGPPFTQSKEQLSRCTMHPSTLHAEPVVRSFGVPLGAPSGDIPLPNHSHIIDGDTFNPIWWQTIAVRVTDESIWPDFNGKCPANPQGGPPCLTSLASLRAAQQRGQASPDTDTNVFLFFDSVQVALP